MSQRIRRKDLKTDEIAEAAFDFGRWLEEHWKLVVRWVGAAVVLGIVIAGFFWMNSRKQAEGERLLAEAQVLFSDTQDADSATEADRTTALAAFDAVIYQSGSSGPGLSALYYKAATLNQLGRTDEAIACLQELDGASGAPMTLRAQSKLLLAGVFAQSGKPGDAVDLLTASMADENSALAPEQALLEIGRIQRELGEIELAHEAWQRIIDEYGETSAANEARQLLGPDLLG